MATSPLPLNFLSFDPPRSSSVSPIFLNSQHGFYSLISPRIVRLRIICCSSQTVEKVGTTPEITFLKKKRKPRPTVLDKIQEKWSVKTTSFREKLPWQEDVEEKEETVENGLQFELLDSESDVSSDLNESVVGLSSHNRGTFPWVQEKRPTKPQFGYEIRKLDKSNKRNAAIAGVHHSKEVAERLNFDDENGLDDGINDGIPVGFSCFKRGTFPPWVQEKKPTKPQFGSEIWKLDKGNERNAAIAGAQHSKEVAERLDFDDENELNDVKNDEIAAGFSSFKRATLPPWVQENKPTKPQFSSKIRNLDKSYENDAAIDDVHHSKEIAERLHFDDKNGLDDVRNNITAVELPQEIQPLVLENNDEVGEFKCHVMETPHELNNVSSSSTRLPWEGEFQSHTEHVEAKRLKKTHTDLAEKVVPEPELKRLRNMALRMVERIKVGEAGVTLTLVNSIHKKWKVVEVVKLKFEGPPAKNMRRTHELLESRTGGLVIWRSGSSVVLYRGMGYKLDCIKSYINQSQHNANTSESSEASDTDVARTTTTNGSAMASDLPSFGSSKYSNNNLSGDELNDLQELNLVLDELGPRYESWSGLEPFPVDADLLPARVHGYITPLRRLPYGIKQSLRDKEMTYLRQSAKQVPPHFVLGRNRELQGLASAMVKLWEKSAIAKIAIKRGVQNTSNERMAEELKVLTGGTLLSRNKEYIVFYRGNDFLPSGISEALKEKEKVSEIRQDEEEKARKKAATLIDSKFKITKRPLVAGTLAETKAATKRWSNQPSSEELEKMMKDSAVARHASLVKLLVNKLAIAKGKITLAEKALGKIHEKMQSSDLPTDLETLTNEERFLFRKIGLSMKTYLPLGRREVFDGTIENMHLHWKHKELVKVIVDGKNLSQVKHIAISLEAESGGVLVSVEKTNKGYAVIVYRGKNYQRPTTFRPKNLLTKRQALSRVTELQRREALKHHVLELQEKIKNLKFELEQMKHVKEIDEETLNSRMDGSSDSDNEFEEDEGCKTNLQTSDDEDDEGDLS